MLNYYFTESIIYIHEVFVHFDNTRMSMAMLHLLYDHKALKISNVCVFWPLEAYFIR